MRVVWGMTLLSWAVMVVGIVRLAGGALRGFDLDEVAVAVDLSGGGLGGAAEVADGGEG